MPTQNIAGITERALNGKRASRWFRNGYLGPFLVIFLTAAAVRVAMVEHYVSAIHQTRASLPFDSIEVGISQSTWRKAGVSVAIWCRHAADGLGMSIGASCLRCADQICRRPHRSRGLERRTVERMYVTWLTDLTDRWNPEPAEKWWTMGWRMKVRHVVQNLLTLAAAAIVLWGVIAGRFRLLPYAPLFVAILLSLPLPHYFTLADPEYTMTLRMWLAVTALCLVALRPSVSGDRAQHTGSRE